MSFEWLQRDNDEEVNLEKKLPISVVLVVLKSRLQFVKAFVLPSIKINNPAEIIIIDDEDLNNQEKRNKGASMATQKYLFICDDDVVMPANHLSILCKTLEDNPHYAFVYTDYQALVMNPDIHPKGGNYYEKSREFNLEFLKYNNYIDTCSLVRKGVFCGFDPSVKRFQDWDLWLTIALKGYRGKYIKNSGIIKFYLDEGITSKKSCIEDKKIILKKHGLSGFLSMLFIDTGEGFTLKNSISKELILNDNLFEIFFDLKGFSNIQKIRFDPLRGKFFRVRILQMQDTSNGKDFLLNSSIIFNGIIDDQGFYLFNSPDIRLHFEVNKSVSSLIIKGFLLLDA